MLTHFWKWLTPGPKAPRKGSESPPKSPPKVGVGKRTLPDGSTRAGILAEPTRRGSFGVIVLWFGFGQEFQSDAIPIWYA